MRPLPYASDGGAGGGGGEEERSDLSPAIALRVSVAHNTEEAHCAVSK